MRLEAGQEDVFVCDGCHYRDAWAPGSGDAFVDGDDAARQLRGFRFFLAENAPDEAAIAALEFAPESLPAKLMDAETYCRLLCLRRGFTPLVSGVKCPVMPGGAERARTIVEVEAEERGRGRNLQLDRGLRNAHVCGKVASDSTEEDRKRPRVRPNGDAAFADDDRAMSKIRKRRNGFRALLPSGLDEEEELLRRAVEASLEETTNAKDARDRETDANTDADPVDPDPVDPGNPRKPRDAKGAGGAFKIDATSFADERTCGAPETRHRGVGIEGVALAVTLALRARRGASERTERRGKRKRRGGKRRESGRRGFRRESGRRGFRRESGRRGRDRGYQLCASSRVSAREETPSRTTEKEREEVHATPVAAGYRYRGYRYRRYLCRRRVGNDAVRKGSARRARLGGICRRTT